MEENLVIVESPAKAKTIEKFLGKDFLVKSSFGHIRDLAKKNLGIDVQNNFEPVYEISPDKKKIVDELKKLSKKATIVWLASDEDREGEAIAWHLYETLGLNHTNTKRIVFHEITKNAILNAIQTPREIDINLVNAQQARRILDRLVGFEVSPVLWKKVKPSLSAGRVQSVSVRLIVEREREIINFEISSTFKIHGIFFSATDKAKTEIKAELSERYKESKDAESFLSRCIGAQFRVESIVTKPSKKSPAPPFTTSTLQQEASRKLGFSVAQTMTIAQKLYESGKITYMRTDSVNLSETALDGIESLVIKEFGNEYYQRRIYKTKTKGAQEAHEAIRPTYIEKQSISGATTEQKLYELIWKRTIASQMADAQLEKTTATIAISTTPEKLIAQGEVLIFEGFLKVYIESQDDDKEDAKQGTLPQLIVDEMLSLDHMLARERFTNHQPRYTEASLVKKLEELGIGRPSTYAPTISTIQQRGYVLKDNREGTVRNYQSILLKNNKLKRETKSENTGAEKAKLFPTDIGMVGNEFLMKHFNDIINYNFTATVEKEFDDIAEGKLDWQKMLHKFYTPFHKNVEITMQNSDKSAGQRQLGIDPKSGKPISVRIGRYGPMVQLGENAEGDEKPQYASLLKGQHIETITLEEALELFKLPRTLGSFEDKLVTTAIGRFGPYIRHDSKFVSLKKDIDDPYSVTLERAITLIEESREAEQQKIIKTFDEEPKIKILNGRWGPYITFNKNNYKIPKNTEAEALSLEDCKKIISDSDKDGAKKPKKTVQKKQTKK